jgi:hypothetical protein
MAAPNYTPVSLYYSITPTAVPTSGNLINGELALNIFDKKLYAKDSTGAVFLLASEGGTAGTVTNVSVVSANGFAGTVANATTAAAITLTTSVTGLIKGNGTAISAAAAGTDYAPATTGTSILYANGSGGFSSVNVGTGLTFSGGTLATSGVGTVTSVGVSGGTTGLTTSGSPITTNGTITIGGTLSVDSGGTGVNTLTGYVKGTGTSPLSASSTIPTTDLSGTVTNAQLANSNITINGNTVSLGGSTNITAAAANALTIGTGLTGTSYNGSAPVTVAIDSTVATLTGVQTLTNKTLTDPAVLNTFKLTGNGAAAYTPYIQTFSSAVTDFNGYQLNYIQNDNNGSDASVDYVAYNDASDVDSYFIDMGIVSSNYTDALNTVFPPNSGYVYTGGGTSGQESDLLLGTSNTASDIVMFTGGTLTANTRATVKGDTGNVLINTSTDTGYKLNVNGTSYIDGATLFGDTVTLNADPTTALEAATKAYVDNAVTAGLHIHEPVRVESTINLNATYAQGGTTFNITTITSGTTVTTSVNHGLVVNDQIWLTTTAGNGLSTNTAYFVYSTPALNQLTLSLAFGGAQITGLTNATSLTYATRANSGVGATLTNTGTQVALVLDGVTVSVADRVMIRLQTNGFENGVYVVTNVGSGSTNWVLTRANDANQVNPNNPNGLGTGDYFFTTEGTLNAGDSHVLTTAPNTMIIGYTTLTYTKFSNSIVYTGGTNIDVSGTVISLTGTVAPTNGGTGTNTVTTGDLLYGSATNTWSKLPLGIAYKSLIVNAAGTQLEWNATPLNQPTAVSGQLGVANGGTGQSTFTDGQLLIGNSTGNTLAKSTLTAGTGISITNGSGSITIAATGTSGVTSFSAGTTGFTPSTGTTGTVTLAGTLNLANGGTGATTVSGAQTNLQVDPAGTAVALAIALG